MNKRYMILQEFVFIFKMKQQETVADFSQELMHSLVYRPNLGSLHSPKYKTVFEIFQERHTLSLAIF